MVFKQEKQKKGEIMPLLHFFATNLSRIKIFFPSIYIYIV